MGGGGGVVFAAGFGGGGGGVLVPAGFAGGGGGGGVVFPAGLGGAGGGGVFPAGVGLGADLGASDFLGSYLPEGFFASFGALFGSFLPSAAGLLSFAPLLASFFVSAGLVPVGFAPSPGFAPWVPATGAPVAGAPGVPGVPGTPGFGFLFWCLSGLMIVDSGRISVTTPAAIVLPPYLNANLDPLLITIGKCNLALIDKLSPGFAILVFSGNYISTAVSAVL